MYTARAQALIGGEILPAAAPSPAPAPRRMPSAPPALRLPDPLSRLVDRLRDSTLVHDLGEDIGTPHWWRGLMTLGALMLGAWLLVPAFPSARATVTPPPPDATADGALRGAALRPLAYAPLPSAAPGAGALVIPLSAAPERATLSLVATLGETDSLPAMLRRAGVTPDDAGRAAALVGGVVAANELAPGTHFAIQLGKRDTPTGARPLESLAFRARFDLDLALTRQGGSLALARRVLAVDTTPLRIRGLVGASLYRSARAAGAPPAAIQDYLRALDEHGALDGIQPTDEFDLVLGWRRAAGGQTQEGTLQYAGLESDGAAKLRLVRWGQDGAFVDALGSDAPAAPQADALSIGAPVAGHVTSGFGLRRHPILGYVRMHSGIDFAAGYGSPIYAVSDGVVSFAGWHGGHGNYVRLDHGAGIGTGYGHMSRIAVVPGMRVGRGTVIGYVGSTGLSTGPHLHYELLRDGRAIDPNTVRFMLRAPQVDNSALQAVRSRLSELLKVEPGAALAPVR